MNKLRLTGLLLTRLLGLLLMCVSCVQVGYSQQSGGGNYPTGNGVRVKEVDGSPNVPGTQTLVFPNGSLTRAGQTVTVTIAGGTTINSTNGQVPYRVNSTTFGDSAISSNALNATGISVTSAAAGSGVTVAATSSGSNEELILTSKGSSAIRLKQDTAAAPALASFLETRLVGLNFDNPTAALQIGVPSSTTPGQIIRLASAQTANALQIENSSGIQLASIAGTSMTSGSMDGRIILYNNNNAANSGAGLEVWHYRPATSGMAPSGKLGFRRFASGSDHGEFAVFLGTNGSMSTAPSMTLDVNGKLNANILEATSSIRAGSANPVGFSYGGSGILRHGMWAVDHLDMFVRVSGTEVATFSWEGHLGVGFSDRTGINARLHVKPTNASTIGAIVQGASAQTANLMEWRNSAGTVLSYVKANGSLVATAAVAGQGLELVSTVSGNTGSLTISPKSTAVGSPPDFEIANTGRLFISSYATLLTGAGGVSITGPLHAIPDSPTQLTADQNNYQAGTGRSLFYRLSSDASRSITGFNPAGGTNQDGELHYFINVGSNNIVLVNESASSTAGNRFTNVTGADITLAANEMAMLVYDNTSSRWRVAKM